LARAIKAAAFGESSEKGVENSGGDGVRRRRFERVVRIEGSGTGAMVAVLQNVASVFLCWRLYRRPYDGYVTFL